ncbi:MAG TPA: hypothetical protein VKU02_15715 [Gemmataceae bacterium]|nr:hypothetical protein [Gemmataceae bacterium]
MFPTPLKTFVHPAEVYRLQRPAQWDQVQHDEARSCGFGPHDRDDVGLWISILPMSLDTDRLAAALPRVLDQALHDLALDNLAQLPWPRCLEGSGQEDGGRVILIETNDSLAASRLLHPDLHHLFSGLLGSPFWAGIPDRSTLVAFSERRALKKRIGQQMRKDHDTSAYPITPLPFLVTRDGIAPAEE